MKRILAGLFIVAVLPCVSTPLRHTPTTSVPFATVALAGHTTSSGTRSECFCEFGTDGICPCCGASITFIRSQDAAGDIAIPQQPASSASPNQPDPDPGLDPMALLFVFALIAWSKVLP